MGKIDLEIFEDAFHKKNSINYELSILVGVDSLCYALLDSSRQLLGLRKYAYDETPASFRELTPPVVEIIRTDALLQKPFSRVNLAFFHPYLALIPNRLYREEEKRTYLTKIVSLAPDDHICVDELPFADAMAVYPAPQSLFRRLKMLFPQSDVRHLAVCLAKTLSPLSVSEQPRRIFVNLRDSRVQLLAFDEEDLHFFNTFSFVESSDLVYFCMLVYEQLGWKPEEVPLIITGMLVEDSVIYRTLGRHFPLLRFLRPPAPLRRFGPKFEESFRDHWFFDLLSISHSTAGYADYRRQV